MVRVLDSGSRGCRLEPHGRLCIVSLSKTLYPLLSTGSAKEDPSRNNSKSFTMTLRIKLNKNKQSMAVD